MNTHTSKNDIKKIAENYAQRIWNEKDLKAIDELLDQKCIIHSALGNFHGPESMKKVVQTWLTSFPDLQVKNISAVCENDLVFIHWQAQGTHKGEFKGIKPTGKSISYSGVTIYRLNKAKIIEFWTYLDMHQILLQLS